jgi:hypothetical protein
MVPGTGTAAATCCCCRCCCWYYCTQNSYLLVLVLYVRWYGTLVLVPAVKQQTRVQVTGLPLVSSPMNNTLRTVIQLEEQLYVTAVKSRRHVVYIHVIQYW